MSGRLSPRRTWSDAAAYPYQEPITWDQEGDAEIPVTRRREFRDMILHGKQKPDRSLSCGRISDEVITKVGSRQTNLKARLRRCCDWAEEQSRKSSLVRPPEGLDGEANDELLASALSDIELLFHTRENAWSQILNAAPAEKLRDLADKPKFLVSAARPKDLASQLVGLRPGRPLIHLGLNRPSDLGELVDPGAALVGGYYPASDGCGMVSDNLILTDPLRLFNEAAKAPDARTAWLGHFVWLTDGDAGPDVPADESILAPSKLGS